MKKIFTYFFLILFISSCADYRAERQKLKLERERLAYENQMKMDKDTCKHYGFKKNTVEFSDCLMKIDIARKENLITRKMLECEAVRRDNSQSAATGFWAGVLMGARENLACD